MAELGSVRDNAIRAARERGDTLVQIAATHHLSRERIRQILARQSLAASRQAQWGTLAQRSINTLRRVGYQSLVEFCYAPLPREAVLRVKGAGYRTLDDVERAVGLTLPALPMFFKWPTADPWHPWEITPDGLRLHDGHLYVQWDDVCYRKEWVTQWLNAEGG